MNNRVILTLIAISLMVSIITVVIMATLEGRSKLSKEEICESYGWQSISEVPAYCLKYYLDKDQKIIIAK